MPGHCFNDRSEAAAPTANPMPDMRRVREEIGERESIRYSASARREESPLAGGVVVRDVPGHD